MDLDNNDLRVSCVTHICAVCSRLQPLQWMWISKEKTMSLSIQCRDPVLLPLHVSYTVNLHFGSQSDKFSDA